MVSVAALYFIRDLIKNFNITIQNHLDHSNKVIEKNSDVMIRISTTIEKLCQTLRKSQRGDRGPRGFKGEVGNK